MSSPLPATGSGRNKASLQEAGIFLHPDRFFPIEPQARRIARRLYESVEDLPILSPHGHTDPRWFAKNEAFPDPATLFVKPDHYVTRMLYSQGVTLEELGIPRKDGKPVETDPRKVWRCFAENYHLFRGTPTRAWLDHAFATLFGLDERLSAKNAEAFFERISQLLSTPDFLPRALFERFKIEALATTESPLDDLRWHQTIRESGWKGRVITAYRPDPVVDPQFEGFAENLERFGALTGENMGSFEGYLDAHRKRRAFFAAMGATSTDHGHPSAQTADLPRAEAQALYAKVRDGKASGAEAEMFRAQMLTEMAAMSVEDGLVMQLHPGSLRNHNPLLHAGFGRDVGADIPTPTEYARALKPLLDRFGNTRRFTLILFTLDETTYGRELAPLAGHYPCLRLGPPWWFFDSFEGMKRFREIVTETAGFYNTVGFNDDTRAFCSIPARHDLARRVDCAYLAELVATHRLDEDEAQELALDLAYRLPKTAYKL
ncbi:MAG: glucuronate isomerase [Hyphomicrobiales bacterium]|nr:glucuronate isomerase [Hyphomicrobiales bacterium]